MLPKRLGKELDMRRWLRKAPEDHLTPFEKPVLAAACILIITMGFVSGGNLRVYLVRSMIILCFTMPLIFARRRGEPYRS